VAEQGELSSSVVSDWDDGPRGFDTSVAHPARVWDYLLEGKDNFAADREAAEKVLQVMPMMGLVARAGRAFLAEAVYHLAAGPGIRQFLDIGTGLPTANNTHEVAQRVTPQARVVYVDNDPIVLAHARALLRSDPLGGTAYIEADIRDTAKILREAAGLLDLGTPVAVILLAVLHFIPDSCDPWAITARLMEALPSYNQHSAVPITPRSGAQITRFFEGLEIVDPGVVPLGHWHPGPSRPVGASALPTYCALGRKP